MVTVLMVSRTYRASALAVVLVSAAGLSIACQKVPLLAPTGSTITLTSTATALPINGSTDIIAQVIRASGSPPHEGTHITFTTTLGTIQPSEIDTDVNGRAVVKYVASGGSGTATITALSGGVSVAAANVVHIAVGAAAVGGIAVSASPSGLPSSGGTATITAAVNDTSGNPLGGVPVTFAIDTGTTGTAGGNGALGATVVTTDATGKASTQLTTSRTTTVAASAGVASSGTGTGTGGTTTGATTVQTARVTITVNTTTSITVTPPAAPVTVGQPVVVTLAAGASTTASPIIRTTVDWGDGVVSSFNGLPASVSHVYNTPNSYLIVVTGVDAFGEATTGTGAVTVNPRVPLTVTFSATQPPQPKAGQPAIFTITVTSGTGPASVSSVTWDFGDQTAQVQTNGLQSQHVYQSTGNFVVTAIVRDVLGNTGSGLSLVTVIP